MTPYFQDDDHWTALLVELESWLKTPYHAMTQQKGRGADCTLFIARACQNIGILSTIDVRYVAPDWFRHTKDSVILASFLAHEKYLLPNLHFFESQEVSDDPLRGDILLIALNKGAPAHHCGIYCGDNRMLHCSNHSGVHYAWYKGWFRTRTKHVLRVIY